MGTTDFRAKVKGWVSPSTGVATPPTTNVAISIISTTVPAATVTTTSAVVHVETNKPVWRDTYWTTDAAALEAFHPTAKGQNPTNASISHSQGDGYKTVRDFSITPLVANTVYYFKSYYVDQTGVYTLEDVRRSFGTAVDAGGGVTDPGQGGGTTTPPITTGVGPKLKYRPPTTTVDYYVKKGVNNLPAGKIARLIWPSSPITDPGGGTGEGSIVSFNGGGASLGFYSVGGQAGWDSTRIFSRNTSQKANGILSIEDFASNAFIYLEGFATQGIATEGCDVDMKAHFNTTVIFANCLFGTEAHPLLGSQSTQHADGVQSWAGPQKLVFDGVTTYTGYQSIVLAQGQHSQDNNTKPYVTEMRNVQFNCMPGSAFAVWQNKGSNTQNPSIENCWYWESTTKAMSQRFRDWTGAQPGCFSVFKSGRNATILRTPANTGINYIPPGYL